MAVSTKYFQLLVQPTRSLKLNIAKHMAVLLFVIQISMTPSIQYARDRQEVWADLVQIYINVCLQIVVPKIL